MTSPGQIATRALAHRRAITKSGLTIYDSIEVGDPVLWIPAPELQFLIDTGLRGLDLCNFPLRTRARVVKQAVCGALGYPVPSTFRKTRPRFVGQCFDAYAQKSNNLQIWNDELGPTRRYVIIKLSRASIVERVKVVTGEALAELDRTGTLTQKYQARLTRGLAARELISAVDTANLLPLISGRSPKRFECPPTDYPEPNMILPIAAIYERLTPIIGQRVAFRGIDQERNRAQGLHVVACAHLGYEYRDDGQFPDIKHQLVEIKLQTSPTIDLGLVRPDSEAPLDIPKVLDRSLRHKDVRYAVFYGNVAGEFVTITNFYLTTGEAFFSRFNQFQGRVLNKKIQIHLPSAFFD